MTFRLGLTGSIGMGKTTTARMFADEGCAVWDADAAVHRLYSTGGAAVAPIAAVYPQSVENDAVSRLALKRIIAKDPTALPVIERIVHPLVAADRADFAANATADILVFDIPLLFETGGDKAMDATVCVSVPPDVQRSRVLERGDMTEREFEMITSRQLPNSQKCARADHVIITDTPDHARAQVRDILRRIRSEMDDA